MKSPRRLLGAAAALTLVAAMTACSSTVAGSPNALDPTAPGALDPGPFRTTPQDPFTTVSGDNQGRIVEGQRMAEFVVLPSEVDPALTKGVGSPAVVLKNGSATGLFLSGSAPQIAEDEKMITGFETDRTDADATNPRNLLLAVMRFPDPAAATRAADRMSADSKAGSDLLPPSVDTPIAGLPDTRATSAPPSDTYSQQTYTPHNDYLIYTYVSVPVAQQATAAALATTAIQKQIPLIDKFPATPPDKIDTLPIDVDGVLKLTVPPPDGQRTTNELAVYGPRGAAHQSTNPPLSLQEFADAGTTLFATDATSVYLNRDADGAKSLYDAFIKETTNDQGLTPTGPAPGVPDSTCLTTTTSQSDVFYCVLHVGKYLGELSAPDAQTANQKAAAQYLILKSVT